MVTISELNDYQTRLAAYEFWNSQSSEYKLKHPAPLKPTIKL